jgi:hypothetical protein
MVIVFAPGSSSDQSLTQGSMTSIVSESIGASAKIYGMSKVVRFTASQPVSRSPVMAIARSKHGLGAIIARNPAYRGYSREHRVATQAMILASCHAVGVERINELR